MRTSSEKNTPPRARRPRRLTGLLHLVLPIAMLAVLACASTSVAAQAAENAGGLEVTVLIYSGRPNPSFVIDDEAAIDELRDAVASAEPREDFEGRTVVRSILGYNGVRVENRSGVAGVPPVMLLYGGTIELRDGGARFVADPGRQLERSLIDQAAERGVFGDDERALGIIREDLGGDAGTDYR